MAGFAVLAPASFVGGTSHFLITSLPYRTARPSPSDLSLLGLGMSLGITALLVGALLVGAGWVIMLGSSESKMIAHTVLVMACVVGGWAWASGLLAFSSPPAPGATVLMRSTVYTGSFQPSHLTVVLGVNATVTWLNDRANIHPDALLSGDGRIYSGIIAPGEGWSYTFTAPGVYEFRSPVHMGMRGEVVVKAP